MKAAYYYRFQLQGIQAIASRDVSGLVQRRLGKPIVKSLTEFAASLLATHPQTLNPQLELHAFGKIESERILGLDDLFRNSQRQVSHFSRSHPHYRPPSGPPFPGFDSRGEGPAAGLD